MNLTSKPYKSEPLKYFTTSTRKIADFTENDLDKNIDLSVVQSFGDEWTKFSEFSKENIDKYCAEYFDIIDETIVNKNSYMIDIGCGTARWSDYFLDKAGFIEAIDPSDAIFAANKLLQDAANVRITKASVDTIPWPDETFDFGMSVGVLHHIPDTKQALVDCVKKIKKGGYFYVYLYYKLDGRSFLFKALFQVSDLIRKLVSRMPPRLKRITCDIIAVTVYMPFALVAKFFYAIGLPKIALKIPLSTYAKRDFYNIRNDALDRFGTKLEQRFTKEEIEAMMTEAGLVNIKFGEKSPFWHCVGQKKL